MIMKQKLPTLDTDVVDPIGDCLNAPGAEVGDMAIGEMDVQISHTNRALLRKIDLWLMAMMCISYMLQFMDKQSLSYASIMGLTKDLNLKGTQYSWLGSIFYFGYFAFSYPASLLMIKLPLGKYLSVTFMIWAVVLACHAAIHNWACMMLARFLLGVAESSISPGFSLITGIWYNRGEQPLRHGLWFAGNSLATMFGGLLAYAVAHINGSIAAWKWLFIIFGVTTFLWSILLLFFLPDTPGSARFLNEHERILAVQRVAEDNIGGKNDSIKWYQVKEALLDYKIWILFFFQLANNIPNGGLTTFSSLVLSGFGFDILQTYLLQMPTGLIHAIFAIGSTFLATKYKINRCYITAVCTLISLIGCIIVYTCESKGARLFGLFIFVGYVAGIPLTLSMISSNVLGFTKKATVAAMMFVAYCTGNIIGPFLFFTHEAPNYQSGFLAVMICFAIAIILILLLSVCWRLENRRRDHHAGHELVSPNSRKEKENEGNELTAMNDLTDVEKKDFRYIL